MSVPNPNYSAQTVTVTRQRGRSRLRPATSNQVNPYGPTGSHAAAGPNGSTAVQGLRFTWTNRENGANVTSTRVRQGNGTMLHNGGAISSHDFMNLAGNTTQHRGEVAHQGRVGAVGAMGSARPHLHRR